MGVLPFPPPKRSVGVDPPTGYGLVTTVIEGKAAALERVGYDWGPLSGLPWGAPVPLILLSAYYTLLQRYNPNLNEIEVAISFGWYLLQNTGSEREETNQREEKHSGALSEISEGSEASAWSGGNVESFVSAAPSLIGSMGIGFDDLELKGLSNRRLNSGDRLLYDDFSSNASLLSFGRNREDFPEMVQSSLPSSSPPEGSAVQRDNLSSMDSIDGVKSIKTPTSRPQSVDDWVSTGGEMYIESENTNESATQSFVSSTSTGEGNNEKPADLFEKEMEEEEKESIVVVKLQLSGPDSKFPKSVVQRRRRKEAESFKDTQGMSLLDVLSQVGARLFEAAGHSDSIDPLKNLLGENSSSSTFPSSSPIHDSASHLRCPTLFKYVPTGRAKSFNPEDENLTSSEISAIFCRRPNGSLSAVWKFNRALYDEPTISRFAANFNHLIENIAVLTPTLENLPLHLLPILSEDERELVEKKFSGQSIPFSLWERNIVNKIGDEKLASEWSKLVGTHPSGKIFSTPGLGSQAEALLLKELKTAKSTTLTELADQVLGIKHKTGSVDILNNTGLSSVQSLEGIESKDTTLVDVFERQYRSSPSKVAVIDSLEALSYRDLWKRACSIASFLTAKLPPLSVDRARSVDLVGIAMDRCVDWVAAMLGILMSGRGYVPLDVNHPKKWHEELLKQTELELILTNREYLDTFLWAEGWGRSHGKMGLQVYTTGSLRGEKVNSVALQSVRPSPVSVCYVLFTSGSTDAGKPKGVVVEHKGVLNMVHAYRSILPRGKPDIRAQVCASTFDLHVMDIFCSMDVGATVAICSKEELLKDLALFVRRRRVSGMVITPTVGALLEPEAVPSLKWLAFGGEVVPRALITKWIAAGCTVINHYGPSECSVSTSCAIWRPGDSVQDHIGRPLPGVHIYLVGPRLELLPIGVAGELCISGIHVSRGYLKRFDLSRSVFMSNPYSAGPHDARLYRTGDRARWLPDGNIHFLGRIDLQVKIRGHRVEPGEIEDVISRVDGVARCVVVLRSEDPGRIPYLACYLMLKPPSTSSNSLQQGSKPFSHEGIPKRIREVLQKTVPPHMIPAAFVILDKLPQTQSGKVDREFLPLPPAESFFVAWEAKGGTQALQTAEEKAVAVVIAEVLPGVDAGSLRRGTNFFELGGNSFSAMQVLSRLQQQALQSDLTLPAVTIRDFFESPTVAGLAAALHRKKTGPLHHAKALGGFPTIQSKGKPPSRFPLSQSQHLIWGLMHALPQPHFLDFCDVWKLHGPVDIQRVETALKTLVKRHQALRLHIRQEEGSFSAKCMSWALNAAKETSLPARAPRPRTNLMKSVSSLWLTGLSAYFFKNVESFLESIVQSDHSQESSFKLHLIDLSENEEGQGESASNTLSESIRNAQKPFQPSNESSLFRVTLVKVSPTHHALVFLWSNLIFDGISSAVFYREFEKLYNSNLTLELPPVTSYGDYVFWERNFMTERRRKKEIAFWEKSLTNLQPLTLRGAMRLNNNAFGMLGKGEWLDFSIGVAVKAKLEALALKNGATLFMALLSAFHGLLHLWSGQSKIAVGVNAGRRPILQLQDMIGHLCDVIPIITDLNARMDTRTVSEKFGKLPRASSISPPISFNGSRGPSAAGTPHGSPPRHFTRRDMTISPGKMISEVWVSANSFGSKSSSRPESPTWSIGSGGNPSTGSGGWNASGGFVKGGSPSNSQPNFWNVGSAAPLRSTSPSPSVSSIKSSRAGGTNANLSSENISLGQFAMNASTEQENPKSQELFPTSKSNPERSFSLREFSSALETTRIGVAKDVEGLSHSASSSRSESPRGEIPPNSYFSDFAANPKFLAGNLRAINPSIHSTSLSESSPKLNGNLSLPPFASLSPPVSRSGSSVSNTFRSAGSNAPLRRLKAEGVRFSSSEHPESAPLSSRSLPPGDNFLDPPTEPLTVSVRNEKKDALKSSAQNIHIEQLLSQVRDSSLEAMDHQFLTLRQITTHAHTSGNKQKPVIISAYFNYSQPGTDSAPWKLVLEDGLVAEYEVDQSWGKEAEAGLTPVGLLMRPHKDGGVFGRLFVQSGSLEKEWMDVLVRQYLHIVEASVEGKPIQVLPQTHTLIHRPPQKSNYRAKKKPCIPCFHPPP